jgi:hypothetical protein
MPLDSSHDVSHVLQMCHVTAMWTDTEQGLADSPNALSGEVLSPWKPHPVNDATVRLAAIAKRKDG